MSFPIDRSSSSFQWACLLLLGLVVSGFIGCGKKAEVKEADKEAAKTEEAPKPAVQMREKVTVLDGRWMVIFTEQRKDFVVGLWDLDPNSDPQVKVFEDLKILQNASILSSKIDGDQMTVQLQLAGDQKASLEGKLQQGVFFGTLTTEPAGIAFVRMFPVSAEMETAKELRNSLPTIGTEQFKQASESKAPVTNMWSLASQAPQLPVSFEAMTAILAQMSQMSDMKWTAEKFADFEKDYLAMAAIWGPRMELTARVNLAMQLTIQRLFPDRAIEQFAAAEKLNPNELMAEQLKIGRRALDMVIALEAINKEGPEAEKAAQDLKTFLAIEPYNPELLDALAEYSLKTNQNEEAIKYLSSIVALPQLEGMILSARSRQGVPAGQPGPRESLIKLWKSSHNDTVDGLDEMLQKLYDSTLESLRKDSMKLIPPVTLNAGHHVPLIESFTGVGCPPCLGASLALESLVETYPIPAIAVLHYHLNIPTPDPLTTQDGEDRFAYYKGEAAPSLFVDGRFVPGVGGILQHASMSYARLRGEVDAALQEKVQVLVTAQAKVENGELTVSASADSQTLPEELDPLRLRVALVENTVTLRAPNGLVEHHFVVRRLLGGAKGTGVKGDELKYSTSMTMADLKQGLEDGIAEIEQNRSVKFEIKPLLLEGLSVVAWVQDDSNRRVLGSVIVPVEGSGESKSRSSPAAVQKVEAAAPAADRPEVSKQETTPAPAVSPATPAEPAAADLPKSEAPKSEAPKLDAPQTEAPKSETPEASPPASSNPPTSSESSRD